MQWRISAIGIIWFGNVFLVRLLFLPHEAVIDWLIKWVQLLHLMMQSLIDWLNAHSWHQLSTKAQPWTAPVSVLGHSWPTFSLLLPVQSSLFTLVWAEFFFRPVSKTPKGVNNFRVTLVFMYHELPSFALADFASIKPHKTYECGESPRSANLQNNCTE